MVHVFLLSTPIGGLWVQKAIHGKFRKTKGDLMPTLVPNNSPPNLVELLPKLWDEIYPQRGAKAIVGQGAQFRKNKYAMAVAPIPNESLPSLMRLLPKLRGKYISPEGGQDYNRP